MKRLDGKVAIVTGAGRGQGRSHAVHLAREGADVVVCGIEHELDGIAGFTLFRPGDLDETVRLVEAEDQRAVAVPANVAVLSELDAVVAAAMAEFGRIDIMVANAGIVAYAPIQEMSSVQWQVAIDVLLTGVFNSLRCVAGQFIAQRSGSFIATSSAVGKLGVGNNANYCAAKWGVIGFVKAAAVDLGPYNVRCNAVCPGYVSTELLNNGLTPPMFFPDDPTADMDMVDAFVREHEHALDVGRLDPSEISKGIVFLASEESRYITGSTLDVSAGMVAKTTA